MVKALTDNPEDLETHVPAHSSERENSDPEGAAKVVTQKRKHSLKTHVPKDRNLDVCSRTKIARVPCRRCDEGSFPRALKFGDLITADHKILNDGSESRNNHRLYKISPLSGYNLIRVRPKLLRRRKRVCESFSSRHRSQKSFTLTIH